MPYIRPTGWSGTEKFTLSQNALFDVSRVLNPKILSIKHCRQTKKTKSGAFTVSGGNTLEETLCLKIMRLKIIAKNEILWSMFHIHDLALGAIPRKRLRLRS